MTGKPAYKSEWDGKKEKKTNIYGNGDYEDGDFRSNACIEILKEADIVVTNPPFSLFREFVDQLIQYKKKFLIIGNMNAVTYKEIFHLIKDNKIWLGMTPKSGGIEFKVPNDYKGKISDERDGEKFVKMGFGVWFTNMPNKRLNEEIFCFQKYDPDMYPTYDNYDAIEVSKVKNIPNDYKGEMGVPISYLTKHNPKHFEIVGLCWLLLKGKPIGVLLINGEKVYRRLIIKHKRGK